MRRRKNFIEENKNIKKEANTMEEVNEEVKEEVKEEEVKEEIKEEVKEQNNKLGKVFGTELLNVRKDPSINSDVLMVLKKDKEVNILEESNEDFYKIIVDDKEGYCMKKFIQCFSIKNL